MKVKLYPTMHNPFLATLQADVQLNLLERAINASSNGIVITDAQQEDNPIIYVNQAFEEITGYSFNEVSGHNCRFLHGKNQNQFGLNAIRKALKEGKECCAVLKNYRKDGSEFWNELYIAPVHNVKGEITNFIGVQTDITKRKLAEEALKKSEDKFRLTFELAPIGMALVGLDGNFLQVNSALCETLGYSEAELMARSLREISDPDDVSEETLLYRHCLEGKIANFQLEKRYQRKDQRFINTLVKIALVRDEKNLPLHYVVQILDVDASFSSRLNESASIITAVTEDNSLSRHFHYDGLTGLPTRVLFEKYLSQGIAKSGKHCAVLFLDLDRFQVINESLGHGAGDQLLREISCRLKHCLQENDLIARSGGDEFAVFLSNIKTLPEAIKAAKTLQQKLNYPFTIKTPEGEINTSQKFITVSVGLTLVDENKGKDSQLLQDAEIALRRAKKKGKSMIEIFDQTLRHAVLRQSRLETDLKQAISRQELYLQYQPIINLETQKLSGFEQKE